MHVVDREHFEYHFSNGAVLYAVPCFSKAGQRDPTEAIPKRATGDEGIRIGMVHGSTFDARTARRTFRSIPTRLSRVGSTTSLSATRTASDTFRRAASSHRRFILARPKPPPSTRKIQAASPWCCSTDSGATVQPRARRALDLGGRYSSRRSTSLRALVGGPTWASGCMRLRLEMRSRRPRVRRSRSVGSRSSQGTLARHARAGVLVLDRNRPRTRDEPPWTSYCTDLPASCKSAVDSTEMYRGERSRSSVLIAERAHLPPVPHRPQAGRPPECAWAAVSSNTSGPSGQTAYRLRAGAQRSVWP